MSRSLPPLAGVFGALFLGVFAPGFAPTGEAGEPLFEKLAPSATGLDFSVPIDTKHPDKRLYYSAMACGGVAAGDLDGDGRPDLFFACGAAPNRLFLQSETPFAFADKTAPDLADDGSWCTGAAMVDIDNDGDLDLYVMRHDAPNRLWINESTPGRPVFTDRAAEHGLDIRDASLVATFHDYDRDGDPDLFLGMNAYYRQGGRPAGGVPMETLPDGQRRILPPWDRFFGVSGLDPDSGEPKYDEIGRPNRLLRNEGGRFADATRAAGLLADPSHTNAAAWWDFDADGWLDLHVSNDFADRDELYRNNRDGTFTEVAADRLQHTAWFSMGSAAEDINGDGLTDLLVADMLPTTHYRQKLTMGDMGSGFEQMFAEGLPIQKMVNTLFVNTGTGLCLEAAFQAGLAQTDWTWTAKSGDFDNDGRVDFYFPTGHSRDFNNSDLIRVTPAMRIGKNYWDFFEDAPELREKNLAFRNTAGHGGVPRFEKAADWGLGDEETMSFGAAVADFDRDGDLDLVTMNLGDPPAVFRNRTANRGLLVALHGARGNRFGLGARLCVEMADGTRQYRTLAPQNGYLESDEPLAHFGLGAADSAKALHVLWPGGARQRVENVAAGRRLDLDEPAPTVADASQASPFPEASPPKTRPLFRASGALLSIGVRETVFDDFLRQPLLPNRHSQLGPGQAWGDLDGDGAADLVIGSPKGAPTRVLIGRGLDPRGLPVFNLRRREPWIGPDAAHEDLGLLAFEADGDGDVDLYLVSGGVECEPGDASLADRLMLNDGTGKFSPAPAGALPAPPADDGFASGGVVTAADFDRDGDLDLFVGGRVVPGKYPLPAR
ncbi:MAG: VCBS repeat-containing protein, partial [Verrucomicrobiae bacterium]|nr:VCBS repeat-containing protein [Verrucomicrobiae bacterium]